MKSHRLNVILFHKTPKYELSVLQRKDGNVLFQKVSSVRRGTEIGKVPEISKKVGDFNDPAAEGDFKQWIDRLQNGKLGNLDRGSTKNCHASWSRKLIA